MLVQSPKTKEVAYCRAPIGDTYLLHLLVLLNDQILVLETHLAVAGGVRVCVRNRLNELKKAR